MKGVNQTQARCRSGQGADSNKQSKTTERHEGCACALKQDKEQAGECYDPRPALKIISWDGLAWRILFDQGGSPSTMLTLSPNFGFSVHRPGSRSLSQESVG